MKDTRILLKRAQDGDKAARDQLIEENMGLVHHIVKRYQGRGFDLEDLFQIGSIGLMKAIDHFDLTYDVCFSTYAVPMIQGEMKRFIRDDGMIKVSRSLKENRWKISKAREVLTDRFGREPTLEELEKETGFLREDIVMAMEAGYEVESIYKILPGNGDSDTCLADQIAVSDSEKEDLLDRLMLKEMIGKLGKEERILIQLRYFQDKTQTEVAEILGTSQVKVSRMEKKILQCMRKMLA